MAQRAHSRRLPAALGENRRARRVLRLRLEDDRARSLTALSRDGFEGRDRVQRSRGGIRAPRQSGRRRPNPSTVRVGAAVRSLSRHARAAEEHRDSGRGLRAALGPEEVPPGSRPRRRAGLENVGARSSDRALPLPGQDPRRRVRAPSGRARPLPRGRGLRLPLARRGLRPAGRGGDGVRDPGRRLGYRRSARGGRRRGALRAAARRALEDHETRESLRRAGPERAALFTWDSAAERTAAALARAARGVER